MLLRLLVNLTDWADDLERPWLARNPHTVPASFRVVVGRFSGPSRGTVKENSESC